MATMNKPCYAAIQTHSPLKPVLVFVSSRRQVVACYHGYMHKQVKYKCRKYKMHVQLYVCACCVSVYNLKGDSRTARYHLQSATVVSGRYVSAMNQLEYAT